MKNLNNYEVTFVTIDFPEDPNAYYDVEDFDSHRSNFQGENIVDALLNGLEVFGYINKENYMKNINDLGNTVDDVFKFTGLDDSKNGVNGDGCDFILFIEDEFGKYIFEDEKGCSEWKTTFRLNKEE